MRTKLLNLCTLLCLLFVGIGNAWGEEYSFTIQTSDFNTTSYAANNGSHDFTATCTTDASKTMTVACTSNQIMQNSSAMQWQKNTGYIYNTTDLGTIKSVTVNSSGGTFTTNYGTAEHPTSGTTVGNGYFTVKVGSATGKTSSIVVVFEKTSGGSTPTTPTVTAPTFDVAAGTYTEGQTVKISNYDSNYMYAYTLDGIDPAFDENLDVTNGTVYDNSNGIEITSSCTLKVIAIDEDGNTSSISSAAYVINKPLVFASLEELVAADIATGTTVTVSFENIPIKEIFVTNSGYRNGIFFDIQKEDKDIEIYYQNVPEEWVVGGTVSGTMTCPWKKYSGTWELAPASNTWAWTNLTYTAPVMEKEKATITYGNAEKTLKVGATDEYALTTTSDGTLTVTSSDPEVATATLNEGNVTITALKAGTTTITFAVAETETYMAAEKKYTLTVNEPIIIDGPYVTFDLTKDETSTATDDKLEWSDVAVTMTADKANASTNANNYYPGTEGKTYTSTRFYKSSTLTFTPANGITLGTIVYEATTTDYASALANSTWANATASVNGTTVTITPTDGTKAVVATIGVTTGAKSITVSYTGTAIVGLSKIELSGTFPTEFTQGDEFSHEGAIVTAEFTDGTTKDVTAAATFSGYNMAEAGEQNVTVSYTEAEITRTCTYTINVAKAPHTLVPAEDGYETVDFTAISPYKDLESGKSAEIRDYDGTSFAMVFAKPQSSTTPTKYYDNGKAVRAYTGNTITITGAEEITDVDIAWVSGYVDNAVSITGIGTKTVVVTFSKTCRFTSITVYYKAFYTENTIELKAQDEMGYWATFSSESPIFIPFVFSATNYYGAAPMTVTIEEGELLPTAMNETFSEAEIDGEEVMGWYVPANTGILLYSESESITYYTVQGMVVESVEGEINMLRPANEKMEGDYKFYKLAYNNYENKTDLGFYWGAADGAAFTCKAGTAYLAIPTETAADVKGFTLGTATGIQEVENVAKAGKIFDLQGRQLNAVPTHGLYIQNGRKMFVK